MSLQSLKAFTTIMIVTGILLLPTVVPHAVQDLQDLKTAIDSASATIDAAPNNSSWGFFNPAVPAGAMGTADLVTNITSTLLRVQYLLNVDKDAWTTPPNTTINPPPTTTTPLENTALIPVANTPDIPAVPIPSNNVSSNTSLDDPYIAYVISIPTLANALTKLGRAWHKELNKPVWDAIEGLEQTVTSFSTSMLSAELVHSQAVLRTIRASASLADAQVAWSRLLNFPGSGETRKRQSGTRGTVDGMRPEPTGKFYTHEELWSGKEAEAKPKPRYALVNAEETRRPREARRFVG